MKSLGVILIVLGMGTVGGGMFCFAVIAKRASNARLVMAVPFQAEKRATADAISVSTARKCQVSAEFHPDIKAFGTPDHKKLRADYPVSFSYRVTDEGGKVLLAESVTSWQLTSSANGWSGHVEFNYNSPKFDPPPSGKLRVEATMANESKSRRLIKSEMKIYDTVSDHTNSAVLGIALCLVGGVVVLLGGGLVATSLLNRRRIPPG